MISVDYISMDIHIRKEIEFEKILQNEWPKAVSLTRVRMSLQQLLDSKTSEKQLQKRLREYISQMDNAFRFIASQSNVELRQQPAFRWTVDHQSVTTSCWRIEMILPRVALATTLHRDGLVAIAEQKHIEAGNLFEQACQLYKQTSDIMQQWRWRIPSLNAPVFQKCWHDSEHHHMLAMKNMCMLSAAIERAAGPSTCFTVAQRAVKHCAIALSHWSGSQVFHTLPIAETMRYVYSSTILWNAQHYGASICTLTKWVNPAINTGPFTRIGEELETIPLLLRERQHTNDGAYFEKVESKFELITPYNLIHTETDVPHPTRMSIPDEAHDSDTN